MAVTQVCAKCNSYLKMVQIIRKRVYIVGLIKLYSRSERKQFSRLRFLRLLHTRKGRTLTIATLLSNTRTNTHTNPKRRNDEPRPTSMLLKLHYSQSANQMLVLFWEPSKKFITVIFRRVYRLFQFSIPLSRN